VSKFKDLWSLLKTAAGDWLDDKAPRLGAALAYYTVFSLAPLLLIAVAVAGFVFGEQAARHQIAQEIQGLVGEEGGRAVQSMLEHAGKPGQGIAASVLGVVLLLVGAAGVFGELQDALNTIWGVQPKPGRGVWEFVRDRFLSFAMVLVIGFLLLMSLVLSAALSALAHLFSRWEFACVSIGLNEVVSLVVITLLFATIFRFLPDAKIGWRDVWLGAAVTAVLFEAGKFLIGLYLGRSGVASAYGAAGSLAVLLIWLYYSAQIFLFGAELTKVYTNRYGSRIVPADNAEPVSPEARAAQGLPPSKDGAGAPQEQPARAS
jgi:membrane protein